MVNLGWQSKLHMGVGELAKQTQLEALKAKQASVKSSAPVSHDVPAAEGNLKLDFGYVGSMDPKALYARYDVRDEVCLLVGGFRHGDVVRSRDGRDFTVIGVRPVSGKPQLWFQPRKQGGAPTARTLAASADALQKSLTQVAPFREPLQEMSPSSFDKFEDFDGERLVLCRECHLPVGELGYTVKGSKGQIVHGECMASRVLQDVQAQEVAEHEAHAKAKTERRKAYGIGWDCSMVPSNEGPVTSLESDMSAKSMCCLVLDEESMTVRLAPTLEPAAAVNLEYISLALQARRSDGVEPLFSLDPVDPQCGMPADREALMQRKRIEPAWLDGTSMGEVLFQADYHLKELSMGEHEQPVVGMRSCLDMSEDSEMKASSWKAREWFVVKNADIIMSEDNALMPSVQMAVEAREQVVGPEGLEDAKLTRSDHPLVKYAEAFSRNFDLIAERKSVVFHLREVARAVALAKFLVEADVQLTDTWYNLAAAGTPSPYQEIPQLWNERSRTLIRVKAGAILDTKKEADTHGVYGGVALGMSQFRFEAPRRVPGGVVASSLLALIHAPFPARAQPKAQPVTKPVLAAAPGAPGAPPRRRAVGNIPSMPVSMAPSARRYDFLSASSILSSGRTLPKDAVQGVDLSMNDMNLSEFRAKSEEEKEALFRFPVEAFWEAINPSSKSKLAAEAFGMDDKKLLQRIFNPKLSDRREDKERFVPPDTSASYWAKLNKLVKEEESVSSERRQRFISRDFSPDKPGAVFPASWMSAIELEQDVKKPWLPDGAKELQLRESTPEMREATCIMAVDSPVFAKSTEDGAMFRIYRSGSLEVRTTQEIDGKETVRGLFLLGAAAPRALPTNSCKLNPQEQLSKISLFVEPVSRNGQVMPPPNYNTFALVETNQANMIVMEKLENGSLTWDESPSNLCSRSSSAKAVRCVECSETGLMVQDVLDYFHGQVEASKSMVVSDGKEYAQGVLGFADTRKTELKRADQLSRRQGRAALH